MSSTRLLSDVPLPGDWAERAACRGMPTQRFFPPKGAHVPRWLSELCAGCPVVAYCRTYALRHPVLGVWAGMAEVDRQRWRQKNGRAA